MHNESAVLQMEDANLASQEELQYYFSLQVPVPGFWPSHVIS
jgi:hypothetical protein